MQLFIPGRKKLLDCGFSDAFGILLSKETIMLNNYKFKVLVFFFFDYLFQEFEWHMLVTVQQLLRS